MKNRYSFLLIIILSLSFTSPAQEGPGGVGNSTNLEAWLDANSLLGTLSNRNRVESWMDQSGNSNHATQATRRSQPRFKTSAINGNPTVEFDGRRNLLDFSSNITAGDITLFTVHLNSSRSQGGLVNTQRHTLLANNNQVEALYFFPNTSYGIGKTNNDFSVFSMQTDGWFIGSRLNLFERNNTVAYTRRFISYRSTSTIGYYDNLYFDGEIAEIIILNEVINSAKRRIIGNYLAAKYNLIPELDLYSYGNSHGREVFGIGRESDGSHTVAKGTGIIEVSNASSLGNGDYLLIGHNNAALTTTASVGDNFANSRFNRVWRADVTNTPGTVDLKFFLNGNNFATIPSSNYRLLIDHVNGSFDNAGIRQSLSGTYNAGDQTVTFRGVSLKDGDYLTLGEQFGVIHAIANTAWNLPSTWDCNCIPTASDHVVISSAYTVSINGADANADSLIIGTGGALTFTTNNTLNVSSNFIIEGSILMNTGKVKFNGSRGQEIYNMSASTVTFWDLEIDNGDGVSLKRGNFELTNFITITAGQFINDGAQFTFISDATNHAQINTSVNDGFSGNFIMKRYFTARKAGYADLTTPVISTTIGDWDQELYMSGVGGIDGNAKANPGAPIDYTVWKYNNSSMSWNAVMDTNTTISAGEPIELFLGDNLNSLSGQTMDSKGTPFTGSRTFNLSKGFNFIGNPYRSFINYSKVDKPRDITNQFYIFSQELAAYQLYTGGYIASEQGFWVSSPGARTITIEENDKFPLNFNQILRQKRDPRFELSVRNLENGFGNYISLVATNNIEDNAAYLVSPEKKSPAITIQADGQKLIQQALSTLENKTTVAVDFYASLDGSYTLSTKDVSEIAGLYNCIILEDKMEKKMIELQENSDYTFNALKGNYERFNIHLLKSSNDCDELLRNKNTAISSVEELQLTQRGNSIELIYQLEKGVQAQLDILSLNGQKAAPSINLSLDGQGTEILMNNLNLKGIYLFVLRTNNKVITEKYRLN
mgnify:CR=1 FL=1